MVDFANGNLCGASKQLNDVLSKGAERASQTAYKTIRKVYKKSGLIQ